MNCQGIRCVMSLPVPYYESTTLIACWQVDFGDFRFFRITPKKIRFLAGSATAFVTSGGGDNNLDCVLSSCITMSKWCWLWNWIRRLLRFYRTIISNVVLGLSFWKTSIFCLNVAELDGEEYLAGVVDPVAQFTAPIAVQATVLKPQGCSWCSISYMLRFSYTCFPQHCFQSDFVKLGAGTYEPRPCRPNKGNCGNVTRSEGSN